MKEHDLSQLAEDLQKTLLELHNAQRINRDIYDYFSDYKSLFTELTLKLPSFIYQRVRPIKRIRRT